MHRFKNLRKRKMSSPNTQPQQTSKQQKGMSNDTIHGETDATIEEHIITMKKEMGKVSNKNLILIKELMNVTYDSRRKNILSNPVSIKETMKMYPALTLVSEVSTKVNELIIKNY